MNDLFRKFAFRASSLAGSPWAFIAAVASVLVWAATGPYFHWSEAHQLAINTFTTITTYLIVFLVQTAQNRDSRAIHLKLDELLRSGSESRNALMGLERASEKDLKDVQDDLKH